MKTVLVIRYKTLLMQRLLDLVQRGYHYYVCGKVDQAKVTALCAKFSTLYFISDNARRRAYRKSKGEGNAFLLVADLDKNASLYWWLLVTDGMHPAHEREKLQDAQDRSQRIRVTSYELLQLGRSKSKGGGVRWTWRMTDAMYHEWRLAIRSAVRSRSYQLEMQRIVSSLYQTPGFGQARVQVGKLVTTLKGEWVRAGHAADELMLPMTLTYIRRLPDEKFTVADWLKMQGKENRDGHRSA